MALTLISFAPNTRIRSAEVNSNFNALNAGLFAITEENFSPSASLPDTVLAEITSANKVNGSAIRSQTIDAVRGSFLWTVSGNLVVAANQGFGRRVSAVSLELTGVYLEVDTGPTGAALIVDINKNGNTIFTTRPQIDDGFTTGGASAVFNASPLTLTTNDKLTLDIDQVGSTVAGANLAVYLRAKQKIPQ